MRMVLVTMLSTMIGRFPHCTHDLPRTVLLPVEQAIDVGRDPADSCPMRPQQRVGAVAHVCVGAHVGRVAHLMTIISR